MLWWSFASEGKDHPNFAARKAELADVLAGPTPDLPRDRGIELVLETGNRPMPRIRPIKRLSELDSEGELAELRRQLTDLLARGWIQHSTAGHAASEVFARKQDWPWRICYDYRGLNAITEPLVKPLPHIDALLDETHGACWFTNFDFAEGYHQVLLQEPDWWKTSFRSQLGHFEWEGHALRPAGLVRCPHARHERRHDAGPSRGRRRRFAAALLPRLFGNSIPVHTRRAHFIWLTTWATVLP